MKINKILIIIFLMITLTSSVTLSHFLIEENEKILDNDLFHGDEIIVKFKQDVEQERINTLFLTHNLEVVYKSKFANFLKIIITDVSEMSEILKILQSNPLIDYAEPNYVYEASLIPNDQLYSYQWHLHDDSKGGINIEPAWNISTGSGATVAVLDTGINRQGEDLTNTCFKSGYDFINNDDDPLDDNGHGTHVAGTIAQSTNNNIGTCGIAFDACLMPVKVLDNTGFGWLDTIAEGIYYAVNNGANIISMSLGGPSISITLENALSYAYNQGVTCIAATGNGGYDGIGDNGVDYPAAYDDYVIAVGATRYDKNRAPYSNYGNSLDVVAPGGDTTVDQNNDGYPDGVLQETFIGSLWDYHYFQGTSMATPHVSGLAALIYSKGITSPDSIRKIIQNSAIDLGNDGWDIYYGHGLINAYDALRYNLSDNPPSCQIINPLNEETVSGNVKIKVTAKDDIGLSHVSFYADDTFLGNDSSDPYYWSWNSTLVKDGSHIIKVIAFDNSYQTSTDSIKINVENTNIKPVADAGGPYYANVDEVIVFNGNKSYSPIADINFYRWDFNSDGTWDTDWEESSNFLFAYSETGNYSVTLQVKDSHGLFDEDSTEAIILNYPEAITNGPYLAEPYENIFLDGSNSTDSEYTIDKFIWDAEEPSYIDDFNLSDPYANITFYKTGEFWIKLTVFNNSGISDTVFTKATISHAPTTPTKPNPRHLAQGIDIDQILRWYPSKDIDGDDIKYDVYFCEEQATTKESIALLHAPESMRLESSELTTFNPGSLFESGVLSYDTTYFWMVVAKDNHGLMKNGPHWNFTTQSHAPLLEIVEVYGGNQGVKFDVYNHGKNHQTDVQYSLSIKSAFDTDIIKPTNLVKKGTIESIPIHQTVTISTDPIVGYGYFDLEIIIEGIEEKQMYECFVIYDHVSNIGLMDEIEDEPDFQTYIEAFNPTDDTFISAYLPDINKGSIELLSMRNQGTGEWSYQTLIKFNISDISPEAHIIDATLHLYYSEYKDNDPVGHHFYLYQILENWSENTVTWNTRPSHKLIHSFLTEVPSSNETWMSWNVTNDVAKYILGNNENYGWKIIDETYITGSNIPILYFNSKENTNFQPYLEIIYESAI